MSELINQTFLDSTFVQDIIEEYIKIDNVLIGELPQFGYKSIRTENVGQLLKDCLADSSVCAILYNWEGNIGYLKTGFDLSNSNDSKVRTGFTAFIVKSKITQKNIDYFKPVQKKVTELTSQTFLDSTFVQDNIEEYIKIDNVLIGELPQFGYKSIRTEDVGQLLKDCLADSSVCAILYNWEGNIGYLKTGFDLSNPNDSKVRTGFTTFIVKSKITQKNIDYFNGASSSTPSRPSPARPGQQSFRINECVRLGASDKTKLELNGRPFVPVGWNAFFLGLLQETMRYPSRAQVTEIFEAARKMKATVIRSHTLGFSAENWMTLIDKNNNFNNAAWEIIDFAFIEAKRCSIKLIIVLCDPYEYYHGSTKTFCEPYGVPKDQFFTHPTPRSRFKQYITTYLNHVNQFSKVPIKNAIEVAFLELGNELGNIRPGAGSTAIPTRDWIQDITNHIKSIDKNHLVLNCSDECLGSSQSNDFSVSQLDCFQSHFYWLDWNRIKQDARRSQEVNRPYIIGEFDSRWSLDWYRGIEAIPNMRGSLAWSIYPHEDGKPTGKRVQHDDGFTFWYDAQSGDNTKKLLDMTNHFRRMQKIPEIGSISF